MNIPYQIQAMMEQLGTSINGAFAYVGASTKVYSCKYPTGGSNSKVLENGLVEAPVSLTFQVNGKRGAGWRIIVNLEANDTYTVRLWKAARLGAKTVAKLMSQNKPVVMGEVLAEVTDVYCDNLQRIVEQVYDNAIQRHCGGFIPIR